MAARAGGGKRAAFLLLAPAVLLLPFMLAEIALLYLRPSGATGADMVTVPAGQFWMGRDDGAEDERPAHLVDVPAFEIDRLPVTTTQLVAFLNVVGVKNERGQDLFDWDDNDARLRQRDGRFVPDPGWESHPAVEPTWAGARDYCQWRGARLPTEAEWEKAARGTDRRLYPWGAAPPDPTLAVFGRRYGDYLPVGATPSGASPAGALDMAGNVWQWVSSLYRPYSYRADDGREDPDAAGERVTRGGGHDSRPEQLQAVHRGKGLSRGPQRGHHNIGFRCARSIA